jgi:hypothetical protein
MRFWSEIESVTIESSFEPQPHVIPPLRKGGLGGSRGIVMTPRMQAVGYVNAGAEQNGEPHLKSKATPPTPSFLRGGIMTRGCASWVICIEVKRKRSSP